ncbi:MAG: tryptophan-rich sensory protein [Erysipelotrichaceae bacterium]|nr:tryptophan-rich sensory protein [Erysipelotrichaceae bacterium]
MNREKLLDYGIPIFGILLVALLGWIFVDNGMAWYETLQRPSEWIPNAFIPIMWTIIYTVFIFYTIHLVRKEKSNKKIITLLIINGILNVLWCLVFFTLNGLFMGLVVIILNLILSVLLLKEICKSSEVYSYILCIYPLWLSIATTLNLACWILN